MAHSSISGGAAITGGAGFIGAHVMAELPRRGHAVRSHERTHAAPQGVDCVIHLAALPSAPRSIQDPLTARAPLRTE